MFRYTTDDFRFYIGVMTTITIPDTKSMTIDDFFALAQKMGLLQQYLKNHHEVFWETDFSDEQIHDIMKSPIHTDFQKTLYEKFSSAGK